MTSFSGPRLDIDPARIATAVGITADTDSDYQFTDAYGVTYTGAPAHLALSALARPDRGGDIYPDYPAVAPSIRATAALLVDWFVSPYTDPQHAAEFAALPPMRVCELVVYLCLHGDADALSRVGPESVRYYTGHLLHDPVPSTDHPLPRLIDQTYRSLSATDTESLIPLQVTAATRDGATHVTVPMKIDVTEDIYWELTVAVPVPVDELNELLMDPDYLTGDYLADRRELIDEHLVYADSLTQQGIEVTGKLTDPRDTALTKPLDQAPEPAATSASVNVDLFFVGPNRDAALATAPFNSRSFAEKLANPADRIFTVGITVTSDALHALT